MWQSLDLTHVIVGEQQELQGGCPKRLYYLDLPSARPFQMTVKPWGVIITDG
jgi:hypothetical protein